MPRFGMAALVLGALLGGACAGSREPRPLRPAAPADDAVELAAMLPEDADRCVAARPRRLPSRRRAMVLPHTWSEPRAYEQELGVVAYASALAESPGGRRARRSYYRFTAGGPSITERLRGLGLRWLDEPCEGFACRRPVARWVDERTVEVAFYEWPTRAGRARAAACVAAARAHPEAFEVAIDTARRIGPLPIPSPRATLRTLSERDGIVIRTDYVFDEVADATVFERWSRATPLPLRSAVIPLAPGEHTVTRDEATVRVELRRHWEELELALQDDRLRHRALALERRRALPADPEQVDVSDLDVVRHQLAVHRARMSHLSGAERVRAAEAILTLLERGWDAHPAHLDLAEARLRIALDVLGRSEEARAVAERVLASGLGGDTERWRMLRREALSRGAPSTFAVALREDGVASGSADALRAAEDLAELGQAGVSYEWAEAAWSLSRSAVSPPRRPASVRLPWGSVLPTLAALARVRDPAATRTLFVVRAPGAPPAVRAIGQSRPDIVAVRSEGAGATFVGASSVELVGLRRLSALIADAVPHGEVEVVVDLRHQDGTPGPVLHLGGRAADGVLHVRSASPELSDVRWARVLRYLARPLADLPLALFPPPELTIHAEDEEVAAALRREAEPMMFGRCAAAGPILRCRSPGQPEQLGELLLRLARARLDDATPARE